VEKIACRTAGDKLTAQKATAGVPLMLTVAGWERLVSAVNWEGQGLGMWAPGEERYQ